MLKKSSIMISIFLLSMCSADLNHPVKYDESLDHPFFHAESWSYPWHIVLDKNGKLIEDSMGQIKQLKDAPKLTHSAKVMSSYMPDAVMSFCDAKLLSDDSLELKFHYSGAWGGEELNITVKNSRLNSKYRQFHVARPFEKDLIWTSQKQKLILKNKNYRQGDEIKGLIQIMVKEEMVENPKYIRKSKKKSRVISLHGPFKAVIK
ncbi:MAG: hypothetical protein OEZ36_01395 [Spirochaetota bacterium]|nr:hypothetical protein [Spirochaetota bacterium]